jgi:hypothetical protein
MTPTLTLPQLHSARFSVQDSETLSGASVSKSWVPSFPVDRVLNHHCSEKLDQAGQRNSTLIQSYQPGPPSPLAHPPLPLACETHGPSEKRREKRPFGLFNVRPITTVIQLSEHELFQRPAKNVKSNSQSHSVRGEESWKNFFQGRHLAHVFTIKVEELLEEDMIIACVFILVSLSSGE